MELVFESTASMTLMCTCVSGKGFTSDDFSLMHSGITIQCCDSSTLTLSLFFVKYFCMEVSFLYRVSKVAYSCT